MTHVQQFLERKADGKGLLCYQIEVRNSVATLGLGYWSEQAFASVHADFKME